MKISLHWLNELLKSELEGGDVCVVLDSIGFSVESFNRKGDAIRGVIVGEIRKVLPHPNADRLSLCTVFDGRVEHTVVCGAPNVAEGIRVPFAVEGATLPNGITIRSTRIRGVESHGMICSEKELEIGETHEGIMHVPFSLLPGTDFCDALGLNDTIIEFEVAPNRPDVLGHIGIAREIATAKKLPLFPPKIKTSFRSSRECSVTVNEPDACRRYVAQVIEGIKVSPSPQLIAQRLNACGIRSINNIVDVTNYVLLETGHPLHAFDYDKLGKKEIRVRFGRAGESIKALDGKQYELDSQVLVIADNESPVAIAGIIGGEDTAVTETTQHILLETAHFDPALVRKASQRLGVVTESSYRFERGIDMLGVEYASQRAIDLILMCAGGERTLSQEAYTKPFVPVIIELRPERVNALLGTNMPKNVIADILNRLSMEFRNKGVIDSLVFQIPSHRVDIKEEIDLIEEIARHSGYDAIPLAPVRGVIMEDALSETWTFHEQVRRILVAAGLYEVYNYGFSSSDTMLNLFLNKNSTHDTPIHITNPVSKDYEVIRTSLLPGLLDNVLTNVSQNISPVTLFEIGKVFRVREGKPEECNMVGCMLTGRYPRNMNVVLKSTIDFQECSGIVGHLLNRLGIKSWHTQASRVPYLHEGQSAAIVINGQHVGTMGLLHPDIQERFKLEERMFFFEINADVLQQHASDTTVFVPLPRYPAVKRDFSFIFAAQVTWDIIKDAVVKAVGTDLVEEIIPFDRYEGEQVREHAYSLSFTVILRSPQKTLTEQEADTIQQSIIQAIQHILHGTLRS